jgi:hypothetical protein
MLDTLPPEILARVLEIAIETWGIGFLPPICRVSSACRDVVHSTPSLWGVVAVNKQSSLPMLHRQLDKAKATDLRITISRRGWTNSSTHKHTQSFVARVNSLVHNLVRLESTTSILSLLRWADMARLEVLSLTLCDGSTPSEADKFFEPGTTYTRPSLHSFIACGLREEWVTRFLSPDITFFDFYGGRDFYRPREPATTIQGYLSRIPNVHTLNLQGISFLPLSASNATLALPNLTNLQLTDIREFTLLLLNIRAPALRVLSIRNCKGQMPSVLSQWSQADFLPSNLQSLELSDCMSENDMPLLIGWLARLPALLRLIITELDGPGTGNSDSAVETDLLKALASPHGAGPIVGGWLCPSLTYLCFDVHNPVADILPILRARGSPGSPPQLRSIHTWHCSNGTPDELAEFRNFFADADAARCLCLGCAFNDLDSACRSYWLLHHANV